MKTALLLTCILLINGKLLAQHLCFDKPDSVTNHHRLEGWSYKDFVIPDGYKVDSVFGDFSRPGYGEDNHDLVLGESVNTSQYDENRAGLKFFNYDEIDMSLYGKWIRLAPYEPQYPAVLRVYLPTHHGALWHSLCFAISRPEYPTENFTVFRKKFLSDKKFTMERTILPVDYVHSEAGGDYYLKWDQTKFDAFFPQLADTNGCIPDIMHDLRETFETRVREEQGENLTLSFIIKQGKYYLYRISKEIY